ncbi:MFS transporter [Kutzneria viridogrisea]
MPRDPTPVVRSYLVLLRLPGAAGFVGAGLVARLPIAMRSVGCVLMVSALTGSYALAGAVAATLVLSQAAVAPVVGRLVDRRGQAPIIYGALAVNVVGTPLLVGLAVAGAPLWTLPPAAVLAGVSALPMGSLARARWSAAAAGTPHVASAYALESVLDEVIYVTGPVLVTALAVGVFPGAGLLGALVLYVLGGIALALQRGTEPPRHEPARSSGRIASPGLLLVLVLGLLTGTYFGDLDVSMIAFAGEHGGLGPAGLLMAMIAAGSLVSGLVYGAVHWRASTGRRTVIAALGLAVGTVPLLLAGSVPVMAACAALAGLAASPLLICSYTLVQELVPARSRTEGFAWLSSAITLGMALGSAVAGGLVDLGGSPAALLLGVGCTAAGFLTALARSAGRHEGAF